MGKESLDGRFLEINGIDLVRRRREINQEGKVRYVEEKRKRLPKGWRGGSLEQIKNSARRILEQEEIVGVSNNGRLPAARLALSLNSEEGK